MGIKNNRPDDSGQGPAAHAPDTEDGLYPDTEGDLGHKPQGDTEPLPGSNDPRATGVDAAVSEPKQGCEDLDDEAPGLDDEGRPTGANA